MKLKQYLLNESIIPKKIAQWVSSKITDKKLLLKMVDGFVSTYKADNSDEIDKHLRGIINSDKIKNGKEFAEYVIKKYKK